MPKCQMNSDEVFDALKYRRVVDEHGSILYYNENDQLHREGGPAVLYTTGFRDWYINGKRHRIDGPAYIRPDGFGAWYINGVEVASTDPRLSHNQNKS